MSFNKNGKIRAVVTYSFTHQQVSQSDIWLQTYLNREHFKQRKLFCEEKILEKQMYLFFKVN